MKYSYKLFTDTSPFYLNKPLQPNFAHCPNTGSILETESFSSVVTESPSTSAPPRPNPSPSSVKSQPSSYGHKHGVVFTRRDSRRPTWRSVVLDQPRFSVPLLDWVLMILRRRLPRSQSSVVLSDLLPWRMLRTEASQRLREEKERLVVPLSSPLRSPRMLSVRYELCFS